MNNSHSLSFDWSVQCAHVVCNVYVYVLINVYILFSAWKNNPDHNIDVVAAFAAVIVDVKRETLFDKIICKHKHNNHDGHWHA